VEVKKLNKFYEYSHLVAKMELCKDDVRYVPQKKDRYVGSYLRDYFHERFGPVINEDVWGNLAETKEDMKILKSMSDDEYLQRYRRTVVEFIISKIAELDRMKMENDNCFFDTYLVNYSKKNEECLVIIVSKAKEIQADKMVILEKKEHCYILRVSKSFA
jgi:hypothetical protein